MSKKSDVKNLRNEIFYKLTDKKLNLKKKMNKALYQSLLNRSVSSGSKTTQLNKDLTIINGLIQVPSTFPKITSDGLIEVSLKLPKITKTSAPMLNKVLNLNKIEFKNYYDGFKKLKEIFGQLKSSDELVVVFHKKIDGKIHKKRYLLIDSINDFLKFENSKHTKNTLQGLKSRYDYFYYNFFGTSLGGKGNFYIYSKNLQPKKYYHYLKDGDYNCVLKQIKEYYNDDKEKIKTIDELNEKYFNCGVSFDELRDICKKLLISIKIFNKCGDMIFSHIGNKRKIFEYRLSYLNHVETHKEIFGNLHKKNIIYVDNIKDELDKMTKLKKFVVYKRNSDNKINYFYDTDNIYKSIETKDIDNGNYYINSNFDLEKIKFEEENKLTDNFISSINKEVFDFINLSCHHVFEIFFMENMPNKDLTSNQIISDFDYGIEGGVECYKIEEHTIDLSNYFCYDKNKAYCNYINLDEYKICKFPSTGKYDIYKCNEKLSNDELKYILENKTGFLQIYNIKIENKSIENIKYFLEDYIYPINVLYWAFNNNVSFDVKTVCINNWKQYINMSNSFIENKIYNKLFGCYVVRSDKKYLNIKYDNVDELQDLLFYSNNITRYNNNEITLQFDTTPINKAHISSYIYGYNMITILNKLIKIDFNDLIGIRVDCIIIKKKYDIFTISDDFKDWKIEKKGIKILSEYYNFINQKDIFTNENLLSLSTHKIYSQKVNYIMAGAGFGKTTRFYKKFDNCDDERLHSMVFAFPNNELKFLFESNYNKYTYHCLFNLNVKNPLKRIDYLKNTCNVVLDEATMINSDDYKRLLLESEKTKTNLFFVGDFNLKDKALYQLAPPNGESFINYAIKGYEIYLNKNYRQNGNKFFEYLQSIRGKKNEDIDLSMFKTISIDDMLNQYTNKDTILSSVKDKTINDFFDKINNELYNKMDILKCKYKSNSSTYGKNQSVIINKNEFNESMYDLNFCSTIHLIQGKTLTGNIYINCDRLFCENLLYVALSRAQNLEQIYIIE